MKIGELAIREIVLTFAIWAAPFATTWATTIHVPGDQATIQAAIDAASDGDTVLVAPGAYNESIDFEDKAIRVASTDGPAVTTIDADDAGPVVTIIGGSVNTVLSGFTITGGDNLLGYVDGGGIAIAEASPTITGNTITGNLACGYGGGIGVVDGSPIIQSNTITDNSQNGCSGGTGGGGIMLLYGSGAEVVSNIISNNSWPSGDGGGISLFSAGHPAIIDNIIFNNLATGVVSGTPVAQGGGIAMVNDSDPLLAQNLIYGNTADLGGGVSFVLSQYSTGPLLINNTITDNITTQNIGSAIYVTGYEGAASMFNNILTGGGAQSAVYCAVYPPLIENNDVFSASGIAFDGACSGLAGTAGNISADPLFNDASAHDYSLSQSSPAIDAGLSSEASFLQTDYFGYPRIVSGRPGDAPIVDMGFAEYQPILPPTPTPTATPTFTPFPTQTPTATPTATAGVINVPGDEPNIGAAIDAAVDGDTVLVAPGTYSEWIDFEGKAIRVVSSGGPKVTTIDNGLFGPDVVFNSGETPASVLSGFTITGGAAIEGPPYYGGGIEIENSSPTISGNNITGNYAGGGGGGIYVGSGTFTPGSSSPIIEGNTISFNTQYPGWGGGLGGGGILIYGAGSAQILDNTILNNSWTSGAGGGIAMSVAGTPLIENNFLYGNLAIGSSSGAPNSGGGGIDSDTTDATIVQNLIIDNNADLGGGIYLSNLNGPGNPTLVNNTVAGNLTTQDLGGAVYAGTPFTDGSFFYNNLLISMDFQEAVHCDGASPLFDNNDIFGSGPAVLSGACSMPSASLGNISSDPLFANPAADDYRLRYDSPAIDAGTNSAPDLPPSDFYGNPRIAAGYPGNAAVIDMGIVETSYQGANPSPTAIPTLTFTPVPTPTPTNTPTATPTVIPTVTPTPEPGAGQPELSGPADFGRLENEASALLIVKVTEDEDVTKPPLFGLTFSISGDSDSIFSFGGETTCETGERLAPHQTCALYVKANPNLPASAFPVREDGALKRLKETATLVVGGSNSNEFPRRKKLHLTVLPPAATSSGKAQTSS